jgi:hypothetical protein
MWNGTTWLPLGSGLTVTGGLVASLCVYNNELYIAGQFDSTATNPYDYIVKWDGSNFSSLSSGIKSGVEGLTVFNSDLIAAGGLYDAGGVAVNNIAKYNNGGWSALGSGVGTGPMEFAEKLAVYNGELYVGGYFSIAGGFPANNIARWNGSSWSALSNGTDEYVAGLYGNPDALYVGGEFITAGGDTMNHIAKWVLTTGISEEKIISNQIYPNPSNGKFVFNSPIKGNLEIFNLLGENIYSTQINERENDIDISFGKPGIYLFTFHCNDIIKRGKIVIE